MANDFFSASGNPATASQGSSATMRAEFASIEDGFDKLPTLTGNGGKIVAVNSGGTAIEAVTTTGTGDAVRATSPTLVTPTLGVASATSINGTSIPSSKTLVVTTDKLSALAATSSSELAGVISDETGSGSLVFATSPTLVTPVLGVATATSINGTSIPSSSTLIVSGGALGTPSSGTLANCTGLPVSTGISGLGSGIATFLATPSSANLASAVTGETGSGALVFATSPTLTTPNIGVATATSVNGTTIPNSATLLVSGGALGTPSSGTLTSCTGLPVSSGISGLGSNVATALAVNVGSSGAFVTNGGALGTPSSGTVTNLTGTASININGTVGDTTPTTGKFTTVSASGVFSGPDGSASAPTYSFSSSGNTDNGMYLPGANELGFSTAGTERMRIDSSGSVAIGTGAFPGKFTVKAASDQMFVVRDRSGAVALDAVNAANTLFQQISICGTGINFQILAADKAKFDANGYLLIDYAASNGAYKLQVNSQIFATDATIATSDGRYKENVETIQSALGIISSLRPVSFSWKQHPIHNFPSDTTDIGFIAQEVQQALGGTGYGKQVVKENAVTLPDGTQEGFLGIADSKLIPLLVKAVQELTEKVAVLESKLN